VYKENGKMLFGAKKNKGKKIMYKNRSKHPGTFHRGDIKYGRVMTKNHHILGDVVNKGCNESRDVLILERFIQQGTL
jgi:hypothetical protein